MPFLRGPLKFPKIKTTNPAFDQTAINQPDTAAPSGDLNKFNQGPLVKPTANQNIPGFAGTATQAVKREQTQIKPLTPLAVPSVAAKAPKQEVKAVQTLAAPTPSVEARAPKKEVQAVAPVEAPAVKAAPPVEETETAQAQTDLQLLNDTARDALVSQDDPVSKAKFNQALSQIGLVNQAQRDLLQQQINSSPDLVGQPTGTALLSMLARQQGADVSNLITSLSLESANRIRDLNKWGFDRLSAITSFKKNEASQIRSELLQAGDFTGYANRFKNDTGIDIDVSSLKELSPATQQAIATQQDLLDAALTSGNLAKAQEHFDIISNMAPNAFKGASFEDMGFADQSYKLRSARNEEFDRQIRLDIAQGSVDDAIKGIETRFTLDERIEGGANLFNEKTLEEINAALTSAGLDTIEDKTELIGQEQELFTAFKISDIVTETGKTVIDNAFDFYVDEMQKAYGDVLLDDVDKRLIRSFANETVTGGFFQTDADGNVMVDPNELVKPWESGSATEHNFKNWPVMDANGEISDKPEFFTDSNPEPDPDSATGQYYADLNKKFDSYNLNTAKNEQVSMMGWFIATKAGTQAFDINEVPAGERKVPGLDTKVDKQAFIADLGVLNDTEINSEFSTNPDFRTNMFNNVMVFSDGEALKSMTAESMESDILNGPTKGFFRIGNNLMRVTHVDSVGTTKVNGKTIKTASLTGMDSTTGKKIDVHKILDSNFISLALSGPNNGEIYLGRTEEGEQFQTIEEFIAQQEAE